MTLNRNDVKAAGEVLKRLLPHQRARKDSLQFLANAICQAHSLAPKCWGVTLTDRMVRLNVGKIETIAIFQECVHLVLYADKPKLRENLASWTTSKS